MTRLCFEFPDKNFYSVAHYLYKDKDEKGIKLWEGLWEVLPNDTIKQCQGSCDFSGTRNKLKKSLEKKYGKKCKTYVL